MAIGVASSDDFDAEISPLERLINFAQQEDHFISPVNLKQSYFHVVHPADSGSHPRQ